MRRLSLAVFVFFCGVGASAQSLLECRQLARERYPEIKQYELISATEQFNLSNAAKSWIPQIVVSGQATYQSATPTYPEAFQSILLANGLDMPGIRKDQYRVGIDVTQNIWDGGQSDANRKIASAEAAEQRSRLDVTLYDLQSRVDDLYFSILLLDERKSLLEAQIEVLDSNLKRMKTYCENGVAAQADVDAIEADMLTARQSLAQVESSRASYRRMLEIFIGQPLESTSLARPEMQSLTSRNSARPELSLFDSQEQKLEAQSRAINSSVMPRFSLFAQGYYGYPGMDMFKSMMSADWTLNAMVGVRMSWNIGAFYTKQNNLDKLNVAKQQIAVQRDVFLFNSEMQTARQDGEIARLQRAVADDERIVQLRRSVRMAAESKLENGVIDSTDLLRKIADETTASLNRSTREIELLQAVYKLKTILNQ